MIQPRLRGRLPVGKCRTWGSFEKTCLKVEEVIDDAIALLAEPARPLYFTTRTR
jgi:hypothetical protein